MTVRIQDLRIVRGDDTEITVSLPASFDSYGEIWFTVRPDYATDTDIDDSNATIAVSLTGTEITQAGSAACLVSLTNVHTLALAESKYVYDLSVETDTDPAKIYTVQSGTIRVVPDVTRGPVVVP
jgi:hypothetical protein